LGLDPHSDRKQAKELMMEATESLLYRKYL
jgi:hypothetical protein